MLGPLLLIVCGASWAMLERDKEVDASRRRERAEYIARLEAQEQLEAARNHLLSIAQNEPEAYSRNLTRILPPDFPEGLRSQVDPLKVQTERGSEIKLELVGLKRPQPPKEPDGGTNA